MVIPFSTLFADGHDGLVTGWPRLGSPLHGLPKARVRLGHLAGAKRHWTQELTLSGMNDVDIYRPPTWASHPNDTVYTVGSIRGSECTGVKIAPL
jgi:hypothetical protein